MLAVASWAEGIRQELGIKAVSQIWAEKPGWYFWLLGSECVHELELKGTTVVGQTEEGAARGLFSVKCYPDKAGPLLARFSADEQELVKSKLFDETGTPRFECREAIPDVFFHVATVEYLCDLREIDCLLYVHGLDLDGDNSANRVEVHRVGTRSNPTPNISGFVRDVPGWDLGYQLFDRLVALYAYYAKAKPFRWVVLESPGPVCTGEGKTFQESVGTELPKARSMVVAFGDPNGTMGRQVESIIKDQLLDDNVRVLADSENGCSCDRHSGHADCAVRLAQPRWWTISEAEYTSDAGCPCGCSNSH
jgi:hypothetical protein